MKVEDSIWRRKRDTFWEKKDAGKVTISLTTGSIAVAYVHCLTSVFFEYSKNLVGEKV